MIYIDFFNGKVEVLKLFMNLNIIILCSVVDPFHFDTDPDPDPDLRIRFR